MYLGRIVEILESETLAAKAVHPYTKMLLGSVFDVYCDQNEKIAAAKGEPPSPLEVQKGCAFAGRCNWCREKCKEELPLLQEIEPGHKVACYEIKYCSEQQKLSGRCQAAFLRWNKVNSMLEAVLYHLRFVPEDIEHLYIQRKFWE